MSLENTHLHNESSYVFAAFFAVSRRKESSRNLTVTPQRNAKRGRGSLCEKLLRFATGHEQSSCSLRKNFLAWFVRTHHTDSTNKTVKPN